MKSKSNKDSFVYKAGIRYPFSLFLMLVLSMACIGVSQDRPNILLILVDDLGYGDLTSYGATDLQSPNIDNIINGGMRFDNFYANCPVCSPTRASLQR